MTERDDDLQDPRLSALYRRKDTDQPPARLDASIRRAARAAIPGKSATRRWWPSLASAAVLVLGVTVALKVFEQPTPELGPVEQFESAPAAPSVSDRPAAEPSSKLAPAAIHERVLDERDRAVAEESRVAPQTAEPGRISITPPPSLSAPGLANGFGAADREPGSDAGAMARDAIPLILGDDCTGYAGLLHLNEQELRTRLERYRQQQEQQAAACVERVLKLRTQNVERDP